MGREVKGEEGVTDGRSMGSAEDAGVVPSEEPAEEEPKKTTLSLKVP